jgi:hypothetical protein
MKKIVAMLLALIMVLAMSAVAMAESTYETATSSKFTPNTDVASEQTITITKGYTINGDNNATDKHPADNLEFKVTKSEYYFNGKLNGEVTPPEMKNDNITVTTVSESTEMATISVKLPSFANMPVGEYVYYLTETDAKTAGVTYTYATNPLILKVTLVNKVNTETGALEGVIIGGIALRQTSGVNAGNANNTTGTEAGNNHKLDSTSGDKDNVHNNYEKGKLTVDKTVTGNMGDTTKPWIFKLTLTPATGETVRGTVNISGSGTYVGATAPTADANGNVTGNTKASTLTIAPTWNTKQEVYFTLTSGQSLTFDNIPEGVAWTIEEVEADQYGYTTTKAATESGTIAANDNITASYVNDKTQTPDTGVSITVVPYVMILAVAMAGAAMMIARRRREEM